MKLCLNLGCGKSILKDTPTRNYINMDTIEQQAPNYIQGDFLKQMLPYNTNTFDEVYLLHVIEHIPEEFHRGILMEMRRLCKQNGRIAIAYPEFKKCAQNYIDNKDGQKTFWKATIYGRGLTEYDRHVSLMDTEDFTKLLGICGLDIISVRSEKTQPFNTIIQCKPGGFATTYEDLLGKEFG